MANIVTRSPQATPITRRFAEWDPFERMRELMQWDPFQAFPRRWLTDEASATFAPRFDVREEKDRFTLRADVPGMREGDLDLSITGNRLTIGGQREEEKLEESDSYYCRERSFGSFSRSFTLPESIDADHIQATMQHGVLEVSIPKRAESQPKRIQLQPKENGSTSDNGGSTNGGSSPQGGGAPSPSGSQNESRTPAGESL